MKRFGKVLEETKKVSVSEMLTEVAPEATEPVPDDDTAARDTTDGGDH